MSGNKTNIDNLFFPSWIVWGCFWPGVFCNVLFLITLFGWQPPVADVYFSPVNLARQVRLAPSRFLK